MPSIDYAAGQVWTYRNRPADAGSLVRIHAIEPYPGLGAEDRVFHVSIVGLTFRGAGEPQVIGHIPVARESLDESLLEPVRSDAGFPDPEEGIASWREAGGGVFTLPLSGIAQMFDDLSLGFAPSGPEVNGNLYFRTDWEHDRDDDPVWVMYEVDPDGRVLRTIHAFRDGGGTLTSVDDYVGAEGELPSPGSLVPDSFFETWKDVEPGVPFGDANESVLLTQVPPAEFEGIWSGNRD